MLSICLKTFNYQTLNMLISVMLKKHVFEKKGFNWYKSKIGKALYGLNFSVSCKIGNIISILVRFENQSIKISYQKGSCLSSQVLTKSSSTDCAMA